MKLLNIFYMQYSPTNSMYCMSNCNYWIIKLLNIFVFFGKLKYLSRIKSWYSWCIHFMSHFIFRQELKRTADIAVSWCFHLFSWSLSWMSSSDIRFSNSGRHQSHLQGSLNLTAGLQPRASDSVAFLTGFLEKLMPLVWIPHFSHLQYLWCSMLVSS